MKMHIQHHLWLCCLCILHLFHTSKAVDADAAVDAAAGSFTPQLLAHLAANPFLPGKGGMCLGGRAFVCITGQVSRLELDNKLQQVLLPLAGYLGGTDTVDVALVLDPTGTHATNSDGRVDKGAVKPAFTSGTQAVETLHAANFTRAVYVEYIAAVDPPVSPQYLQQLKRNSYPRLLRQGKVRRLGVRVVLCYVVQCICLCALCAVLRVT